MNRYWKAWGSLIGSAVGVAVVHGLAPEGLGQQVDTAVNTLGPVVGALIGTILAPKNGN